MILFYKYSPTLWGPIKHIRKHHYKLKRYDIISLVYYCCKKMGHKASNCWHPQGPNNPCKSNCQYYILIRYWEAKCSSLHLQLHPKNRTTKKKYWRLNVKEKYEFLGLVPQGAVAFQWPIAIVDSISSHEMHNTLMSKEILIQLLFFILQWRHLFLEIWWRILRVEKKKIEWIWIFLVPKEYKYKSVIQIGPLEKNKKFVNFVINI